MDFCVIGHLTLDEIVRGLSFKRSVGGTAYYSSIVAKILGWNCMLISKVGFDFPREYLEFLESFGIDTSRVIFENISSTSFLLRYNGDRTIKLMGRCSDIHISDLGDMVNENVVVHIGPVAGEVSMNIVKYVHENSKLCSVDLQGFIRFFDSYGFIKLVRPIFIDELFEHTDFLHCDFVEASVVTGIIDPVKAARYLSNKYRLIVLLTMGREGMYLAYGDLIYHIPSIVDSVVEETGAGDICTTAFLYLYNLSGDLLKSAIFSSSLTSIYIESGNLLEIGNKAKINSKMDLLKPLVKVI